MLQEIDARYQRPGDCIREAQIRVGRTIIGRQHLAERPAALEHIGWLVAVEQHIEAHVLRLVVVPGDAVDERFDLIVDTGARIATAAVIVLRRFLISLAALVGRRHSFIGELAAELDGAFGVLWDAQHQLVPCDARQYTVWSAKLAPSDRANVKDNCDELYGYTRPGGPPGTPVPCSHRPVIEPIPCDPAKFIVQFVKLPVPVCTTPIKLFPDTCGPVPQLVAEAA